PKSEALRRKVGLQSRRIYDYSVSARITLGDSGLERWVAMLQFRAEGGRGSGMPIRLKRFEIASTPIAGRAVQSRGGLQIGHPACCLNQIGLLAVTAAL